MLILRRVAPLASLLLLAVFGPLGPAVAGEESAPPLPDVARARLGLPSAYVVGKNAALPFYRFQTASFKGRDLHSNQGGVLVGITESSQLSFDFDDIQATGRHAGNRFDGQAWGVSFKHRCRGWERPDTALSLEFEYRAASADAQIDNTTVKPPDARVYALNADCSRWLKHGNTLHLRAAGSRLTLGPELDGWALGFSAGADHRLGSAFLLEANGGVVTNFGDAKGTDVALSGGIHYGKPTGLFADVAGTFFPSGIPVMGGPMADASIFRMDPALANQAVVQQMSSEAIGVFTAQVGFRAQW